MKSSALNFVQAFAVSHATLPYTNITNQFYPGSHYIEIAKTEELTFDQQVVLGEFECNNNPHCPGFSVCKFNGKRRVNLWDATVTKDDFLHNTDWDTFWKPADPCAITDVTGKWQGQFAIAAPCTLTFKHGTTKTKTETRTEVWNNEVTTHVAAGFTIFGFGTKASVDEHVGSNVSNINSQEWTMSEEEEFQIAFQESDVGMFVWQFEFIVDDTCLSGAQPMTKQFALTAGAWEEPCCIPGFCADEPTCSICHSEEFMIPGAEQPRCRIASSTIAPTAPATATTTNPFTAQGLV